VLNGRYGPYITDKQRNARIPKDRDPKTLTLDECRALLAAAPVGVAIEYQKNGRWWQLFIDTRSVVRRVWSIHGRWGNEWAADYLLGEHNRGEFMLPARIVSLADRDAPPASRGPIGEG
jgi:hypothetical protein